MSLIYIGKSGKKKVLITPYCQKRLQQRNLNPKEVLQMLTHHRHASYPIDEDGRQKIRATIGNKKAFLTIMEDSKKIIVITGGEA